MVLLSDVQGVVHTDVWVTKKQDRRTERLSAGRHRYNNTQVGTTRCRYSIFLASSQFIVRNVDSRERQARAINESKLYFTVSTRIAKVADN